MVAGKVEVSGAVRHAPQQHRVQSSSSPESAAQPIAPVSASEDRPPKQHPGVVPGAVGGGSADVQQALHEGATSEQQPAGAGAAAPPRAGHRKASIAQAPKRCRICPPSVALQTHGARKLCMSVPASVTSFSDSTSDTSMQRPIVSPSARTRSARIGNYKLPRRACSRSRLTNNALKFPWPKPRQPCRSITSKNNVGRSCTGAVKICNR